MPTSTGRYECVPCARLAALFLPAATCWMLPAAAAGAAPTAIMHRPPLPASSQPQFAIWQLANPNTYMNAEVVPAGSFYTPQNITVS